MPWQASAYVGQELLAAGLAAGRRTPAAGADRISCRRSESRRRSAIESRWAAAPRRATTSHQPERRSSRSGPPAQPFGLRFGDDAVELFRDRTRLSIEQPGQHAVQPKCAECQQHCGGQNDERSAWNARAARPTRMGTRLRRRAQSQDGDLVPLLLAIGGREHHPHGSLSERHNLGERAAGWHQGRGQDGSLRSSSLSGNAYPRSSSTSLRGTDIRPGRFGGTRPCPASPLPLGAVQAHTTCGLLRSLKSFAGSE